MSTTGKTILMYSLMAAVCAALLLFPDAAFAQAGGAIRAKLDAGRETYALPIAIGIIAVGSVISVVLWLFDVIDWKGMAKWLFGAMVVGVIAAAVLEMAG